MAPKRNMKEMEFYSSRESLMNSLNRNKDYVINNCQSMTAAELEARLSLVESIFTQLCDIQSQVETKIEDASQYETRQVIEDMYCDIKAKILSYLTQRGRHSVIGTDPSANSTLLNGAAVSRVGKLPMLKLPEFSGKYTEWTSWYNAFTTLIEADHDIDELSKFIHLKSCLSAVPLRTIECLELSAVNYRKALQLLRDRFENKAIIVQSHVSELFNIRRLKNADAESLGSLVDAVNSQLVALRSLGNEGEILEALVFHLVRSKLDDETLEKWESEYDCAKLPSWQLLAQFLCNRGINLAGREVRKAVIAKSNAKGDSKRASLTAALGNTATNLCYSCSSSHHLKMCPKFKSLSPLQRYYEVKKFGICLVCFSKRHQTKDCSAQRCSACNKPHHELLHRSAMEVEGSSNCPVSRQDNPSSLHSAILPSRTTSFLATAVVLVQNSNGKYSQCRCVLDSGSQLNFITTSLASQLKLNIKDVQYSLNGIGNAKSRILGEVQTTIKSRATNFVATDKFSVLQEITRYNPATSASAEGFFVPSKVKLADPFFDSANEISMLLGVNLFFKLIVAGQIKMGINKPLLQKSLLGWIVVGECITSERNALIVSRVPSSDQEDTRKLHKLVQRFWQCEEISQPENRYTEAEQTCETQFVSSVRRTAANRFVVRLPFKVPKEELGESYSIALTRFLNLERKLIRNPELKRSYTEFIEEYRMLDHLEEVGSEQVQNVRYVMPHHPVIRPESSTTKLRVVFDASCKTSNGLSLNDIMLVGPTLQPDLFDILTRFRFYKYALTADISKMYRQILVESGDCNYQCILWRQERTEAVKTLRLKTVTYGTNSAPFLAVRCLYYLAEQAGHQYPLASEAVKRNFYMDDMLCGADSINELKELKQQVTELLKLGRFELHKWRSNFKFASHDESTEPLELKVTDAAKTLGIRWASTSDKFQFAYGAQCSDVVTKRVVLSELAQLFDPLGFLSPIIILGKVFMQELWLLKQGWDEDLPPSHAIQWKKYRSELKLIHECSLPRAVIPNSGEVDTVEFYGFSDASCRAFGAAIYARVIDKLGTISVNLVAAKSKVAPVRVTSLPRLELEGARLLVQLMAKVKKCVPRYVSSVSRWTTFVANRVALIHELSSIDEWFKIESKLNPADIVSRGLHTSELRNSSLWWKGPKFLQQPEDQWPAVHWNRSDSLPEQRNSKFTLVASPQRLVEDIVSKCKYARDFVKLTRVFGYICRWRRVISKIELAKSKPLTASEVKGGLNYIIFNLQSLSFHEEIVKLHDGKLIRSAKIQALNPFLDVIDGIEIIRVGGRLSQANVPFDTKHPILLPNNHIVITALFEYTHRTNMHAGAHALCAFVRQRYWVINARKLARKTVRSCLACFRQRPVAANQIMGSLPASRVQTGVNPFQRAGLDFAGPFWMHFHQRGRRPTKMYMCVFVCFLTKACHLELVSDLSTNAFIAALKRFFARRGLSAELFCDNATNFVGAAREVKELTDRMWNETGKRRIENQCSSLGVQFHFIPPRSPHFGGLWESAVKVAKQLLVRCFNGTALDYEELATAIAQAEAVMNSRPLCPLSSDPNDLEALTPGHFLIGRPLNAMTEACDEDILKLSVTNRWKRIVAVHHSFWRRWSLEYLTLLQERRKWASTCNNLQRGTLVLIGEDNTPPGQWVLGRIQEVHPGADGAVRVVTVKTKAGLFKRNIHKLCPLPISD
ncbi:uncharacterized protein LOC115629498 [Scaptodrosophila lebanonensis]|uniref:Uncharacterized protein LOC115629498 n=1 Tax=Drosophila lebanonensis TaxID=7225 RepID=A0A6J2U3Y7_DROLE|nr:uncharacterized protein LOC115629498 [Scaptodrosophila lebanonensis]